MARSSCPKCSSNSFELIAAEPQHANYKYLYLQCTSCGAVVGISEFWNLGAKLFEGSDAIPKRLAAIEGNLGTIDRRLSNIESALRR